MQVVRSTDLHCTADCESKRTLDENKFLVRTARQRLHKMTSAVRVEFKTNDDGFGIGVITLSRKAQRNAVDLATAIELANAVRLVDDDKRAQVGVLFGVLLV